MLRTPAIVLHVFDASNPCQTIELALTTRGLAYERVVLPIGSSAEVEAIYGAGRATVPGALIDGRPVHTSLAIMDAIDALVPDELALYPQPDAESLRVAAHWADSELQALSRTLLWGALRLAPHQAGVLAGRPPLDPALTDIVAARTIEVAVAKHDVSFTRIGAALERLPIALDHLDRLVADGLIRIAPGELPNGAELAVAPTLSLLAAVGDVRDEVLARPSAALIEIAPRRPGVIAPGAFPPAWRVG